MRARVSSTYLSSLSLSVEAYLTMLCFEHRVICSGYSPLIRSDYLS